MGPFVFSQQEMMELAGNAFNGGVVAAALTTMMTTAPWHDIFGSSSCAESAVSVASSEQDMGEEIESGNSTPDSECE